MNEEQRLQGQQVKPFKPLQPVKEKDYSQFFQKTPSLKDAKKRGKEEIEYHADFKIDERFAEMGRGRKFYIRTYGCQMNEHDTEVMAGIFEQLGYEATDEVTEANVIFNEYMCNS